MLSTKFTGICCLLLATWAPALAAHTLDSIDPFHVTPGDYLEAGASGASFSAPGDVTLRCTPTAGGADIDLDIEFIDADSLVGARVPNSMPVGQYDCKLLVGATPSDPPDLSIWVRERPFNLVRKPTDLPGHPPSAAYKDADFADLDADGFLDVFEANSLAGDNIDQVIMNKLGATALPAGCAAGSEFCNETATRFENSVAGIPDNNRTYDADLVDLDLDGDLDLVRVDRVSGSPLRLFINDGDGNFTDRSITRSGIGSALLPALGDMDAVAGNSAEVDAGDVDGDGRPDLILCSWSGASQNLLLLNRLHTSGAFEIANDSPCNPASAGAHALCKLRGEVNRGCAFGDFNNDGDTDIIAPTMDPESPDFVLLNTGLSGGIPQFDLHSDWVKSPSGGVQTPVNGGDLKVADLDGDGDDDVVIASPRHEQKGRILWNDEGTRLVELDEARYPATGNSYDVDFSDIDRDGDLDMIFSPEGTGGLVFINRGGRNGNMQFTDAGSDLWKSASPAGPVAASPNFSLSVSLGDYDLDGDHDLLSAGGPAKIWESDLFDQPGEDRDWVFALDRTRSMISGTRDFFEPSKNVIRAFLAQRRAGDAVGLVTFDYTGTDSGNPNAPDNVNKAQVDSAVGAKTPGALDSDVGALGIGSCTGFCTALGWAIKTGYETAAAAPDADREKVLVLATDGRQNQAPHPDTIIPDIPSNVRLYIVALGTDTDDRMLSALATNGGKFYFAGRSDDYTSVQSDRREIDNDIEADTTGRQRLLPVSQIATIPLAHAVLSQSRLIRGIELPLLREEIEGEVAPVFTTLDHFIVDPADRQVRFTLSWRGPSRTNAIRLVDPKGRVYPGAIPDRVRENRSPVAHVVEVLDPLSGVWRVESQISENSGPGKLTAMATSGLKLDGRPKYPVYNLGEAFVLDATVSGAKVPVQGQLILTSPSKQRRVINAQGEDGDLHFEVPALGEPGAWNAQYIVAGPPERPFLRTRKAAFVVAELTDEEPDLRNAVLSLSNSSLAAGTGETEVTLELTRRDGAPLSGADVSFQGSGVRPVDTVTDHGDGRYSQTLAAGERAGRGWVAARVGLVRLPDKAEVKILAGQPDAAGSRLELLVGPLQMCTGHEGEFGLRLTPVDEFGNAMHDADVAIEQSGGPSLTWAGPVQAIGAGEVYERHFKAPEQAGNYRFEGSVNGVALDDESVLEVFEPDSPEGIAIGCFQKGKPGNGDGDGDFQLPWWVWLLIIVLIVVILVAWLVRRNTP